MEKQVKPKTDDPFALLVSMFAYLLLQEIDWLSDTLAYLYRWVLKGMLTLSEYSLQFQLGFPFYFGLIAYALGSGEFYFIIISLFSLRDN